MADNKANAPVDLDAILNDQTNQDPLAGGLTGSVTEVTDSADTDKSDSGKGDVAPTPTTTDDSDSTTGEDIEELEFDNAGNLVNKEGKVVFNKADIKFDEEGNPVLPDSTTDVTETLGALLEEKLGVKYDGKLDEVTPATVSSYLQGAVEKIAETVPKAVIAGLVQEYPDLGRALNHLQAHGDLRTFNNTVVSTNYTLPADTDVSDAANAARRTVLALDLEQTFGIESAKTEEEKAAIRNRVKDMVDVLDTAGKLQSEASAADARIRKREEEMLADADRRNADKIAAEQAAADKYWNDVRATIRNRDLGGVVIPETEISSFEQYLTVKGKDGLTQEQRDYEGEDVKTSLQIAYLRYKKFNLQALVDIAKKKEKVEALKAQKQFVVKRNSRPGGNANPSGVSGDADISLERLLTI
jgi:hypothetical protein